ncbi:VWA domain-containing protein [Streptomyces diastaticus]|uniref:vWA domain-containing protein n=1 Tax=Streptomyces TaxID=1883 RepID=UPI0027D7EA2A|nr:VWA domain-containing protein [Streptomyces sp. DSM 41037]
MGANLPVDADRVRLELGRAGGPAVSAAALLLTGAGRVRSGADLVARDQPGAPGDTVRHLGTPDGAESVEVDLAALAGGTERVALCVWTGSGTLGQVTGLYLRLVEDASGAVLAHFDMAPSSETALVAGELYRRSGSWRFRAVGQGYDHGFAGLAADFGLTRAPARPTAPTPRPAPAPRPGPSAPTASAGGRRGRGEELLPADMGERLSLRKEQVATSLRKGGLTGVTARVILVLDASGSMSALYARGTVARVAERMAAVAALLDDDGTMQAWTFGSRPARLPDLHLGELPEWLRLHVRVGQLGVIGRKKRPKSRADGQVDMRTVGIQNEEQKVIADVRSYVRDHPIALPTLVLFFSDGGVYRSREIERELRAAADEPVFWQFVGLGRSHYGVLEYFDTLPGRTVDNVGFFAVDDVDQVADPELYDRLLSEFPLWLGAAREAGVLR